MLVGWPPRKAPSGGGPRRYRLPWGKPPRSSPLVGAVVIPGEAVDAAAAPSPSVLSPTPALIPTGAVADLPEESPVTADVETAEAPPPLVIPDLPIFDHEEGAVVVAEVGERRPITLAEERPETSTAVVPDAPTAGGPDASAEGCAEPWPALGSSGLIPTQLNPNEWCGQSLVFWSHDSPVPPSERWLGHASRADCAANRWLTGQSGAPPDSPVIFSRTPPTNSRERPVDQKPAWRTGHCPVHHRTVRCTQTAQSLGCSSQVFFLLYFL
jgi:hypothetical protein